MRFPACLVFSIFQFISIGQNELDLYSPSASKEFANYLFVKNDFKLAADEYARILHMNPADDAALVRLSSIYRKLNEVARAQDLFSQYRGDATFGIPTLEKEYLATLLFQENTALLDETLTKSLTIDSEEKQRISVEHALLRRRWGEAKSLLSSAPAGAWKDFYLQKTDYALAFRPKKPWLASTMSIFIPGSGKVYAKNTKEGITSFLFVAALGYQSYRAFDRKGSKSVAGWIYGGLGLGFYLGNIYGAQQSAKNYNNRKRKQIHSEVDNIIYQRY